MTWQDAATLHQDQAGLMLDVQESGSGDSLVEENPLVLRVRVWNQTARAVIASVHHAKNAQKVFRAEVPPGTGVTEANVPPGLGINAWNDTTFQLVDA